jgi:hypothetical protein
LLGIDRDGFETIMIRRARQQRERTLEAARRGCALQRQTEMPFAGHRREVTGIAQQFGQRNHTVVQIALITRLAREFRRQRLSHRADSRDVMIGAGEQHRTGRRAGGRRVEVREAHACVCKRVEVGRRDLAAECAEVGEAEIVSDDHEEVGALRWCARCRIRRHGVP